MDELAVSDNFASLPGYQLELHAGGAGDPHRMCWRAARRRAAFNLHSTKAIDRVCRSVIAG